VLPRIGLWALAVALAAPVLLARAAELDSPELPDPALLAVWENGLALEHHEALLESAAIYEVLAAKAPASAFLRWRLARNYWRYAERLPATDRAGRLEYFTLSRERAEQGLAIDPECGECVLWKVASMGRLATTAGAVQAAGQAAEIAELIEYGISLRPAHSDGPRNSSLANLYYAGSAFHRLLPDWFWLGLVIGVRGDNHKALDYIRKAIELNADRVDYQVELGAVLLCIGTEEDDPERLAEGFDALRHAETLEDFQSTDAQDRQHAAILMREPERACGYSRDGWVDVSAAGELAHEAAIVDVSSGPTP
jgi:hypothetical protein